LLEEVGFETLMPPTEAFPFALSTIEGETSGLGDYKGRLLLLHFWATWSPPAPFEVAELGKLQRALHAEPFTVLAVAIDVLEKPAIEAFVQEHSPSVPVLLDLWGEVSEGYNVRVLPTSILIDGRGRVIGRAEGARSWSSQSMIDALKRLVEAPAQYGIIMGASTLEVSERKR
jgi:peroxiredoxin